MLRAVRYDSLSWKSSCHMHKKTTIIQKLGQLSNLSLSLSASPCLLWQASLITALNSSNPVPVLKCWPYWREMDIWRAAKARSALHEWEKRNTSYDNWEPKSSAEFHLLMEVMPWSCCFPHSSSISKAATAFLGSLWHSQCNIDPNQHNHRERSYPENLPQIYLAPM